jgi:hypothetical protein
MDPWDLLFSPFQILRTSFIRRFEPRYTKTLDLSYKFWQSSKERKYSLGLYGPIQSWVFHFSPFQILRTSFIRRIGPCYTKTFDLSYKFWESSEERKYSVGLYGPKGSPFLSISDSQNQFYKEDRTSLYQDFGPFI